MHLAEQSHKIRLDTIDSWKDTLRSGRFGELGLDIVVRNSLRQGAVEVDYRVVARHLMTWSWQHGNCVVFLCVNE